VLTRGVRASDRDIPSLYLILCFGWFQGLNSRGVNPGYGMRNRVRV